MKELLLDKNSDIVIKDIFAIREGDFRMRHVIVAIVELNGVLTLKAMDKGALGDTATSAFYSFTHSKYDYGISLKDYYLDKFKEDAVKLKDMSSLIYAARPFCTLKQMGLLLKVKSKTIENFDELIKAFRFNQKVLLIEKDSGYKLTEDILSHKPFYHLKVNGAYFSDLKSMTIYPFRAHRFVSRDSAIFTAKLCGFQLKDCGIIQVNKSTFS